MLDDYRVRHHQTSAIFGLWHLTLRTWPLTSGTGSIYSSDEGLSREERNDLTTAHFFNTAVSALNVV